MECNGYVSHDECENSHVGTYHNTDESYEQIDLDGFFEKQDGGLDDYSFHRDVGLGLL